MPLIICCGREPSSIFQVNWRKISSKYNQALDHALATVPAAHQFQELFPGALNGFTYYTGTAGHPGLYCETSLYDRYQLKLDMEVGFDESRARVKSYGEPTVYLTEYRSIKLEAGGGAYIEHGPLYRRLKAGEWQRLYEAHGDFSVLGVELVKDRPVPNFKEYWELQRQRNG